MWRCVNGHVNVLPTIVITITKPMVCWECMVNNNKK